MATLIGMTNDDMLSGTDGADVITGDAGNDSLFGRDGDDFIDGGVGNDLIYGGLGNDTIIDGPGIDTLYGGAGIDTFERSWGSLPADTFVMDLNFILGLQAAIGGTPEDADKFSGFENYTCYGYIGGRFTGNSVDNRIDTDKGVDTIFGNGGNDQLLAGAGQDRLYGGPGNDALHGQAGQDTMTGGAGSDRFHYYLPSDGGDRITDFGNGDDLIYLASEGFGFGPGRLTEARFVSGAGAVALDAGDRIVFDTSNGKLWFDSNGNSAGGRTLLADLQAGAVVTAADILLL